MSHEITATRQYVEESMRKTMTGLTTHVGDLLMHVSAEDRARWNSAGRDGRDGVNGQDGHDGQDGRDGADGKSAYEIACDNGFEGTITEWLESLKGKTTFDALTPEQKESLKGDKGDPGDNGSNGNPGAPGTDGQDGVDGKSAYEIACDNGFEGTITEWLESLKGGTGDKGENGTSVYVQSYEPSSEPGGKSVLVLHDSRDTRIEIYNGVDGADGKPGKDGADGKDGKDGRDGTVSIDSMTAADRAALLDSIQEAISNDPNFVGEKGETGERGSRWHASDTGTFSGNDTTPGNFSGVGTFVDDAHPGDMLLMTATHKIYECLAARGEAYDGVVQAQSLWMYRMAVGNGDGVGALRFATASAPSGTYTVVEVLDNQSVTVNVSGGTTGFELRLPQKPSTGYGRKFSVRIVIADDWRGGILMLYIRTSLSGDSESVTLKVESSSVLDFSGVGRLSEELLTFTEIAPSVMFVSRRTLLFGDLVTR